MEEFLPSSWTVYHTHNGPCPYRAVGQWDNLTFYADQLPIETYETLLGKGFRRSGTSIYHPACENCRLCIPLRVHVPPSSPVAPKSEHSERTKICELNTYPLFSGKMSLNYTDAIRNIGINVETLPQEKSSLSF